MTPSSGEMLGLSSMIHTVTQEESSSSVKLRGTRFVDYLQDSSHNIAVEFFKCKVEVKFW